MGALAGKRILIIEDEPLIAMVLEFIIEGAGAQPLGPATTVAEALTLVAEAGTIDAAVLDYNLGEESSEAVAQRLRAAGIPWIWATGQAANPPAGAGMDAPMLFKPYREDDVIRALTAIVS